MVRRSGMTLADVCLFAYTHVADAGEFNLERYPKIVSGYIG